MTDVVRSEGEGMARAQNVTQQPNVQLGELIAYITARVTATAQMASDVATAGRDRGSHNQLTDAQSTGSWFPREQAVGAQEDVPSQVTGSMPGKWMAKTPSAVAVLNL